MPDQTKENTSHINQIALMRMMNAFGPQIVEAFIEMERQLIKPDGVQNFFNQLSFINPGDHLNEGDLVPTIHCSLQPFQPIFSESVEIESTK